MAKFTNYEHYIDDAQAFAQPILYHLRECVHTACPGVEETFKWSFPNFLYKGKILCHMASFKEHVAFGFWLGSLMQDPHGCFIRGNDSGMGQFGKISKLEDLPERGILLAYIREAMDLIDAGKTLKKEGERKAKVLETPAYLEDMLSHNPVAEEVFRKFSQSHRNEYIEWITEAKTEATRQKRLSQTIEWLHEGKSRNWKYAR